MGISEKMNQFASSVQSGVKNTGISLFGVSFKLISSLFFTFTITLIAQEMIGFATLGFIFMSIVLVTAMMRLFWNWSMGQVLIFDLICILTGLLMRLYIQVAP